MTVTPRRRLRRPARRAAALLAASAGLVSFAWSTQAEAFCQTASCDDGVGVLCNPASSSDCGIPVFWPSPCIGYSMQRDASVQVALEPATAITRAAFQAWTNVDCGGGANPRLVIEEQDEVECAVQEYNPTSGNANAIIFRDDDWPYGGNNTLALTTVTFNLNTGEIRDVDMEINTHEVSFSISDEEVTFDLLSVLTHEAGHFLGIAHSELEYASMYAAYSPGDLGLRTLTNDDIAAICTAYPPGEITDEECKPSPRGGLMSECATVASEDEGDCAVRQPGASRSDASSERWGLAWMVLALLAAWARRRERA